jgi:chorismate--pyruvate lyase
MRTEAPAYFAAAARWHQHVNAVRAPAAMVDWLTNRASLTARLVACCQQFRVQRLLQSRAMCLDDEFAEIGLARPERVVQREVLLRCDGVGVVYAHTVLPNRANATQWPLFAALGERSLGTTLFSDPLVMRGELAYARLRHTHPLLRRIQQLQILHEPVSCLHARRSVFQRKGGRLLVTEVFLPAINTLSVIDTSREYR